VKHYQIEILYGRGHKNIQATHKSTLEFTKETTLTKRGDCIVAVNLNKGLSELDHSFLNICKSKTCKITVTIMCEGISDKIIGYGHPNLSFKHPSDIVIRKSQFICPRTLMINANKAAKDLNRELVESLKNPASKVEIKILAEL